MSAQEESVGRMYHYDTIVETLWTALGFTSEQAWQFERAAIDAMALPCPVVGLTLPDFRRQVLAAIAELEDKERRAGRIVEPTSMRIELDRFGDVVTFNVNGNSAPIDFWNRKHAPTETKTDG